MASAHENVQGCVTYHERPASTPCDAPPAAPTARGRARTPGATSRPSEQKKVTVSSRLHSIGGLQQRSQPLRNTFFVVLPLLSPTGSMEAPACARRRYRRTLSAATTGAAAPAGGLAALPVAQGCVVAYRRPARRIRAARPSRAAPQWNVKRLRRNLHRLGCSAKTVA